MCMCVWGGGETRQYALVQGGRGRMRRQGGSTRTAPLADRPGRPAEPLASPTASIRCLGRRLQGRSREGSENGSAKVAGRLRAADGGSPPGARGRRAQTGSAARKHRPGHGVVRTAQGVTKARGAAAGRRPGASHGCVCVCVCVCGASLVHALVASQRGARRRRSLLSIRRQQALLQLRESSLADNSRSAYSSAGAGPAARVEPPMGHVSDMSWACQVVEQLQPRESAATVSAAA